MKSDEKCNVLLFGIVALQKVKGDLLEAEEHSTREFRNEMRYAYTKLHEAEIILAANVKKMMRERRERQRRRAKKMARQ
ncbi:MAG TPA: hypothetical protein VKR52_04785 [Terracidiphilus sp.]|nr:hypothetical protein [Terracidiphilus sp.]